MENSNFESDKLIVHLPLKSIVNGKTPDLSPNNLECLVQGNNNLTRDNTFGSLINFDGNTFVSLPQFSRNYQLGYTIMAFVKVTELRPFMRVFDFGSGPSTNNLVMAIVGEARSLYNGLVTGFGIHRYGQYISMEQSIQLRNGWTHLAITFSPNLNNRAVFYINGIPVETKNDSGFNAASNPRNLCYIGKSNWNTDPLFVGNIANFRFYERGLTSSEIAQLIQIDSGKRANGVAPLSFDLYTIKDDDHVAKLFIENAGKGDPLVLEIRNTSGFDITLEEVDQYRPAGYHFRLVLKKGVLSSTTLNSLRRGITADGWIVGMSTIEVTFDDVIFFVRKSGFSHSLKKDEMFSIRIPELTASASSGIYATNIEIGFGNSNRNSILNTIKYSSSGSPIKGVSLKRMEVINHVGVKSLPLVVGIDGDNTLLNDGNQNNIFIISIRNGQKGIVNFTSKNESNAPTTFVLDIPKSDSRGDLFKLKPTIRIIQGNFDLVNPIEGLSSWELIYNGDSSKGFSSLDSIQIEISNFQSSHPTGGANVFLSYRNIPGFWDGGFSVPIRFSSMVEKDSKIGIGTGNPTNKLHVRNGGAQIDGDAIIQGKVGIGGNNNERLHVNGGNILFENNLETRGKANFLNGIYLKNKSDVDPNSNQVQFEDSPNDILTIKNDEIKAKGRLKITSNHDFSIVVPNNENESSKFSFNDPNDSVDSLRILDRTGLLMPVGSVIAYAGVNPPKGWLLCDGNQIPQGDQFNYLRNLLGGRSNVPDLRGRFVLGDAENTNLHQLGGVDKVQLTVDQLPAHSHTINGGNFGRHFKSFEGQGDDSCHPFETEADYGLSGTDSMGGNQPHENMPPFYVLTYIIKY